MHVLACIYRFGDHCWLSGVRDARGARLQLSAVNMAGSAFALFTLDHGFFDALHIDAAATATTARECQVHVRTLLAILRARGAVRTVTLTLAPGADCLDVHVAYAHGMLRRHRLTYGDAPSIFPHIEIPPPFSFQVNAQTVREWLDHFGTGRSGECTLAASDAACVLRSAVDEPYDARDKVRRAVHTEVRIDLAQLDMYDVAAPTHVTFSLWEFRAAAAAAEQLGVPLRLEFGAQGEPLFIYIEHAPLHAEVVIATAEADVEEMGGMEAEAVPPRPLESAPPRSPPRPSPNSVPLSQLAPSLAPAPARAPTPTQETVPLPSQALSDSGDECAFDATQHEPPRKKFRPLF